MSALVLAYFLSCPVYQTGSACKVVNTQRVHEDRCGTSWRPPNQKNRVYIVCRGR
jgi:hypothetical protein